MQADVILRRPLLVRSHATRSWIATQYFCPDANATLLHVLYYSPQTTFAASAALFQHTSHT